VYKFTYLGRGKIPKLIDSDFNVCRKYSVLLEEGLLVKISIKLFYTIKIKAFFAAKITI